MIVLLFGWLVIGSAWVLTGWFLEAVRHSHTLSRFNAPLVLAVAMDLHALGFALQLSGRLEQVLHDGANFDTAAPIYWVGISMLFVAKTLFVWVAALREGRNYSLALIWSYWLALVAWGGFSLWWTL